MLLLNVCENYGRPNHDSRQMLLPPSEMTNNARILVYSVTFTALHLSRVKIPMCSLHCFCKQQGDQDRLPNVTKVFYTGIVLRDAKCS